MKKETFNNKLREYVRSTLSPTNCGSQCGNCEKCFVTAVYASFKAVLGDNQCIQIGSYPRFTAIRPLHDLDILYVLGDWNERDYDPEEALKELLEKIKREYVSPPNYVWRASLQTHSITVNLTGEIIFSVDIVPAYAFGRNKFGNDTYKVPEILEVRRGESRKDFYDRLHSRGRRMKWIHTDPRGYIEAAKRINQGNSDFRKTVKIVKAWKNSCKEKDSDFKLKSFHIEQVITRDFQRNGKRDIFSGVFEFFVNIPKIIGTPQVRDRADQGKFIDAYLKDLSQEQKNRIIQARDGFLKKLEEFSETDSVDELIDAHFYQRVLRSKEEEKGLEKFLFDYKIPICTDDSLGFVIDGYITSEYGKEYGWLSDANDKVRKEMEIDFQIRKDVRYKDYTLWKVRNSNDSPQPRGEITKHQTPNDPETTQYDGTHYVECYAILNGVCVAKSRQYVIIPGT